MTVADIVRGVSSQANSVEPCLRRASESGMLSPDRPHRLVLDFVIEGDGGVRDPEVVGPAAVRGTSLAACVQAAMMDWRFPAAGADAPVRNFPFGPFTIHSRSRR